jgi:two-component system chemotaxis response regulator CheB
MYATVHMTETGKDLAPMNIPGSGGFDVIGIGASAGGIVALQELLTELPEEFPCPILVVQHLPPSLRYRSALDEVLGRCTKLNVKWAETGEALRAGNVRVAPQDHHLQVLHSRTISLTSGQKVNGSRPAVDLLFDSIAANYGTRGIAVVLSGALWDGAKGACHVAAAGGRVLVQDRETAEMPDMPLAALRAGAVDFAFSPRMIARTLIALTMARGAAAWFQVWHQNRSLAC